jgi:ATP-dependent helicase/nuclease subunit A
MEDLRGLQGFLQDARNDTSELKRQMEEGAGAVRLMTVHGSKGLEAPIVFLPDTIRANASKNLREDIMWPERDDDAGVPLWVASSADAAEIYRTRQESAKALNMAEYRRLLYVALTRSSERLYIAGAQKSEPKYIDKRSWYFDIEKAFESVQPDETGIRAVSNRQTDKIAPDKKIARAETDKTPPPAWMFEPAPDVESPPRPLMPSKPDKDDPAVMSPLLGDLSYRYRRGRIIHTLLQFLPALSEDERILKAAEWLQQPAHKLTVIEQNEILEATLNVLNDARFANIFTPQSLPEVPVTGLLTRPGMAPTIVSGQIDRLVVDDTGVTILDYKTNRPAPKTVGDVPEAYRRQMRTYRDLLAGIWPGKPIRCALLWTDGPNLMDVTDSL